MENALMQLQPPQPPKPSGFPNNQDDGLKIIPSTPTPEAGEEIKELDINQIPPLRIKIIPDKDKKGVTWHLN